ncbi:Uncharacterised protein [Campylobacter hyointestinalis]|nr:Uncharacterised protein [Campylobacter hyointestinalis]
MILSAKAPVIIAQDIMAKVIWNTINTDSGIELAFGCTLKSASLLTMLTPFKNNLSNPPTKGLPDVKAIEYHMTTQSTLTMATVV